MVALQAARLQQLQQLKALVLSSLPAEGPGAPAIVLRASMGTNG